MGVIQLLMKMMRLQLRNLKLGDNDTLSAMVASIVDADVLIILSDVEGVYTDKSASQS